MILTETTSWNGNCSGSRSEAPVKRPLLAMAVTALLLPACQGGSDSSSANDDITALKGVGSIVILQRQPRMGGVGDVFQYTSYVAGAKLLKLSPPTADGTRSTLCCDQFPEMKGLDIQAYDVAFDAKSIVFSGRIEGDSHYGLYLLTLTDKGEAAGAPTRLATNMNRDYVYPIFAPKDRIVFVTNEPVTDGSPQHQDEYERGTTTQLGSISTAGTDEFLGPTNLSHRTAPTMLADGRVLFTQWDHLGGKNEGNLMVVNPDLTTLREGFGKEGKGLTNSYLKAVEIEPYRLVAIGTSRSGTIQAGKLLDIHMGEMVDGQMVVSEAHSHAVDLTPKVPADGSAADTVGRYYDATAVKRLDGKVGDSPLLLVSWANGPVDEETLSMAGLSPDFGVYLYDSATQQRYPVLNDQTTWEVMAKPLASRPAVMMIDEAAKNGISDTSVLIGSLNVNVTSLSPLPADRPIVKVRVIEGFSGEEGPRMFGLTEDDGAARLGEVPVFSDGSWAATIPANVPVHLQPIDSFGMSVRSEPVWFSGRPGESRFCGGCHESRTGTTVIQPGITQALASGKPPDLMSAVARADRKSVDFSRDKVVGMPWDKAFQAVLDKYNCKSCHDGDSSKAGNRVLTLTDAMGNHQTITFNLSGDKANYVVGAEMISAYTNSHLSLLGVMTLELEKKGIMTTGDLPVYVQPEDAHGSLLFKKLNPKEVFVKAGATPKYFCETNDCSSTLAGWVTPGAKTQHPGPIADDDMYLLLLTADMGGQFFSRENSDEAGSY